MDTETDILLATAFLAGMVLFSLAMFAIVLRLRPRRGTFDQPAAALERPGSGMRVLLLVVAVVHVVAGVLCRTFVPGAGVGVLVVLLATAAFYVLCALSPGWAIRFSDRRRERGPRPD